MIVIPAMITPRRAHRAPEPQERQIPPGTAYRSEMACPDCGRSNWHVGRFSAECAFCGVVVGLTASLQLEIVRQ